MKAEDCSSDSLLLHDLRIDTLEILELFLILRTLLPLQRLSLKDAFTIYPLHNMLATTILALFLACLPTAIVGQSDAGGLFEVC
jgi:hypothetical protein